jgi:condensation enzyme
MTSDLSLNQEFLCSLDHGEAAGAFSQWYTITYGLRLRGAIDAGALSAALDDVVARHETLRTSLRKDDGRAGGAREEYSWRPHLHQPGQVSLEVRDVGPASAESAERAAYDLLDDVEAEPFSPAQVPLLRAVLGRLGAGDHVLALNTHHVASDAWSMQVIIRDLAACYAARAAGRRPDPPPAVQYSEFTTWQRASEESWSGAAGRWRERLAGARVHALPVDRVLPAGAPDPYSVHKFVIGRELTEAASQVARSARSSLFVVLLAAYNLLASQLTSETAMSGEAQASTDLVVPTFTAGRNEPRFAGVVGPLYNLLPIRTDLDGCGTFADVIARTRASCLQAYASDIPFPLIGAQAPDLMAPCGDDHLAVCAFEMLPPSDLTGIERAGDVRYAELRNRRTSRPAGASTPKGMLWALDHLRSGELVGVIRFGRDRFDEGTIAGISERYRRVLSASIAEPTARLVRS